MKKLLLSVLLLGSISSYAQRKVLIEEFTGANCINCPMGSYFLDSMLNKYPDLVGVSLHSYTVHDSMFFSNIDTLGNTYAAGAPLAAIDRVLYSPGSVAIYQSLWDAHIQQRLAVPKELDINLSSTWTATSRNISAQMDVNILSNMQNGDYRLNLYVVEDSVSGTGFGYDQENGYDAIPGNPFYGKGNPIQGYIHRHVVRAILPSAWGLAGIIGSTPASGQSFSHTFNYTLPSNYNENRISLVAFVSSYTAAHDSDSVYNVTQKKLSATTTNAESVSSSKDFYIFPNPSPDAVKVYAPDTSKTYSVAVYNCLGQSVYRNEFKGEVRIHKNETGKTGIYFLKLMEGNKLIATNKIVFY